MSVIDTWLGEGVLLASLHLPDGDGSPTGVVICPPLGQEHVISYRTLRLVGQELESRGIAAIRFNYPGQGDSTVVASPGALLEGARMAAAALRAAGCTRIAYLGLSGGALVASEAAAADPGAAGLVLWDPPTTSGRWLRRARSLYATSVTDASLAPTADGGVTVVGLELDAEAVREFTSLHYRPELSERMPLLVAVREEPAGKLPEGFFAKETSSYAGAESPVRAGVPEVIRVAGHESLLDVSSVVARIPGSSVDAVVAWAADRLGVEAFGARQAPLQAAAIESAFFSFKPDGTSREVSLEERIVRIGPDRLFAIETWPVGAPADIPGMLLEAGSAEHRIGATRHQVALARELAANGVRVVRVDRRGTGETGRVHATEPNLLYAREWLVDNDNAIRYLDLAAERVGVTGLCSGGWLALMSDPKLAKLRIGIGVGTFRMDTAEPGAVAAEAPRVNGEVSPGRTPLAAWIKGKLPYGVLLLLGYLGRINIAEPLLRRLLKSGSEVVLLMTPMDQELFADRLGFEAAARLRSAPGELTLVSFDEGDHALFESGIRRKVVRSVVEQTVRVFGAILESPSVSDNAQTSA